MIDKLRSIAIFTTVVDQGTFRAAALHLGLAPSRISEIVSDLEQDLGVTLLYRSTRQLSLTQEGRVLHDKAQAMLATVESGLDAINQTSREPNGVLRITAPAFVTQTALIDRFASFARAHPRVDLQLDFSDAPRDLIKDGYDLGIRAGWLEDSDLMTRNLGRANRKLIASPTYTARHPAPQEARDLEAWDWIGFAMRPSQIQMTDAQGVATLITMGTRVTVNTAAALYAFAVRGLGVTAIPDALADQAIARGDLVEVLPEWSLAPLGLHAVWPDQSRRESLTVLFVRHLAEANDV